MTLASQPQHPMNFEQGQFNFDADGNDAGYHKWQEALAARKKQFESRYGIILGSKVRLTLHGEAVPLEGIITLCDANEPKNQHKLRLNIGSRIITLDEIESIARL